MDQKPTKPCPFCGAWEVQVYRCNQMGLPGVYQVRCDHCASAGPKRKSQRGAIHDWDDRTYFTED